MELDEQQKQEFMSYWGGCPLKDTRNDLIVTVDGIDGLGTKDQAIFGSSWEPIKSSDGTPKFDTQGNVKLVTNSWTCPKFEQLQPVFIEPGYYPCYPGQAYWITRKPERGMMKGIARSNTSFIGIRAFQEKLKEANIYTAEFDFRSIVRFYYGFLKYPDSSGIDHKIAKFLSDGGRDYSFAISKNVALVQHKDYDIPVVMYKLTPVGYYIDNKVLLSKKKDISKETIEEEAKLCVEIYEE